MIYVCVDAIYLGPMHKLHWEILNNGKRNNQCYSEQPNMSYIYSLSRCYQVVEVKVRGLVPDRSSIGNAQKNH